MRFFLLLPALLVLLFATPSFSQVEIVSAPDPFSSYAITFGDKAYVAQSGKNYFSSYDGDTFTPHYFPVRDGSGLLFDPFSILEKSEMVLFNASIYFILDNGLGKYLYSFDGNDFNAITIPGEPASDPIVFEDKLYVLSKVGSEIKLFSYNGTSTAELPIPDTLPEYGYEYIVRAAGEYLYVSGFSGRSASDPKVFIRFDGITFLNIPLLYEHYGRIEEILPMEGTEDIFIKIWDSMILHFDGTTISEVYDGGGDFISSFLIYNDILYFQSTLSGNSIYKFDGTTNISLVLPDGATPIFSSKIVEFEDKILIPATLPDGRSFIFEYDGTNYVRNFEFPEIPVFPESFIREGKYLIILNPTFNPSFGSSAFEYDGISFTEITAPVGKYITKYLTSNSCFHLWNVSSRESSDIFFEIAKEDKECKDFTIIPGMLGNFQRVDFWMYGKYRDWCWTDIFWDFEIDPICPVPGTCPDPLFAASLTDQQGKEVWSEQFKEPFKISFPFEDKHPYTFTLSSIAENSKENLFILDDDLIANGLSAINISMVPQKNYFLLKAETDKGEEVPFLMRLVDKEGKVIWREEFTAPMEKEIEASVDRPGATLQFLSIPIDNKQLEVYGITEVSFYPNPSKGRFLVDIMSEKTGPATITVTNLQGEKVWQKEITAPIHQVIDMTSQKPGFYILTVRVGDAKVAEQIMLEH